MKKIKYIRFLEEKFFEKDRIAPAYINNTNPKYLEIDNMFYSGLIFINYYREYEELILKRILDTNLNMNVSLFYEKQNNYKTIRDLTYHIANVGIDLQDGNKNQQDIDIATSSYNDAKYIRREIQVNNEDLYFLYIYLTIFSREEKELEYLLTKAEGFLNGMGIQTRRSNFRQEQIFSACTPLAINNINLKKSAKKNILTKGIISTYPFITSTIFDENGIFIGTNIYNNSLIFIDRYNAEKYKNANMCIFRNEWLWKIVFYKNYDNKV